MSILPPDDRSRVLATLREIAARMRDAASRGDVREMRSLWLDLDDALALDRGAVPLVREADQLIDALLDQQEMPDGMIDLRVQSWRAELRG